MQELVGGLCVGRRNHAALSTVDGVLNSCVESLMSGRHVGDAAGRPYIAMNNEI